MQNQQDKTHYNYFDIQLNMFEINANYSISQYWTLNHR